ncbi:hypothetical protein [Fibrobacter sp. UWB12]|uniref:hypothetical protein n=1 Tax=Fibrobacter sp. UWB12 TaxID=1896203 RepID=UPI0020C8733E|nr:hypothetical protein [Fibrobacter sp. UWB12]
MGCLVIAAIVIVLATIAIQILIALLPVLLVIGGMCLVFFIVGGASGGVKEFKKEIAYTQNTVREHMVQFRDDVQRDYHEEMLSMTLQKSGVNFNKLRPEMDSAISVVVSVYHTAMNDDKYKPLITSANDYEGHSERSAHYVGAALDFRIKDMGSLETRKQIAQMVRDNLGNRYTVLHEDIGQENEHLHVQLRNGTYNRNAVWK